MLAQIAKKEVSEKAFVKFWSKEGYPKKRVKTAWQQFQEDVLAVPERSWAEQVFNSSALLNLAKDVVCGMEGLEGPERKLRDGESWDARNEYSLAGEPLGGEHKGVLAGHRSCCQWEITGWQPCAKFL
eukprot:symbB.v1.2.024245.t1/scaffold2272.1/size83748/2